MCCRTSLLCSECESPKGHTHFVRYYFSSCESINCAFGKVLSAHISDFNPSLYQLNVINILAFKVAVKKL